jgi:uncharacterized protein (TIGR02452 family)
MKPIKTIGLQNAMPKNKNAELAKETLEIIRNKKYTSRNGEVIDISNSIDFSIKNTVLYKNDIPGLIRSKTNAVLEVVNETTAQAAVRLQNLGKTNIVALNFAAARNPGGGFLSGAVAQEEDLCRCSALYACIKSKPIFYNENILCDNAYYTDNIIYSPDVPFIRNEYNLLLEKPFKLSIITSPAPNVNAMDFLDEDVLLKTLSSRARKILQVASNHGHTSLILGAWGCGAFGNNPSMVANVFLNALRDISVFEHVCFPVYDIRENQPVFNTFKQILG